MFKRISHIGVVVRDIEQALTIWRDGYGLKPFKDLTIEVEGIRSLFLSVSGGPGEFAIELMQPLDPDDHSNAISRRLAEHGEGFYHLAVIDDATDVTAEKLRAAGMEIIQRPPLEGAEQGRWLVHPRSGNGVMVEGVEEWNEL